MVRVRLLKMPILNVRKQVHYYPHSIYYDTRFEIPPVRRAMMRDPSFSVSMDGNELYGARFATARCGNVTATVDGEMGGAEAALLKAGITSTDNWFSLGSAHSFGFFAYFDYLTNAQPLLALHLMEGADVADKPGCYLGQLPNIGYRITDFPGKGDFGFAVMMCFSQGFDEPGAQIDDQLRRPVTRRVQPVHNRARSGGLLMD
jgi:hypothetical protein